MKKLFVFILPALFMSAFFTQSFTANDEWQEKVEPVLLERTANGSAVKFLVILENNLDFSETQKLSKDKKATAVYDKLRQGADAAQVNVINYLKAQNADYQAFFIVNMVYTEGNAALIKALAEMPEVQKIQTNPIAKVERLMPATNAGMREITWGIDMINADDVWEMGYRGEGVVVGGQDTGYEWEHPALKAKYRGWDGTNANHNYNWHDAIHEQNPLNADANNPCGFSVDYPCDDNNHGTHTMGTMVGTDEDGGQEIGVAPNATWIACRNMDRGWGQLTTYVECFEWFLAPTDLNGENPDPTKAPHVIANSWGCPEVEGCNPDNFAIMETAVDNLKAAGTVVVVSAGNDGGQGCSSVQNPAAIFENSFSIGATNSDDEIAGFSSRGPVLVDNSNRRKPDVSAPGVGVLSAIRNGEYASFSGTSMAGPHVAGAVALIISANPALAGQVEEIEDILEQTAVSKTTEQDCGDIDGDESPNNTYGYGRIDVLQAVELALEYVSDTDNTSVENNISIAPNPFVEQFRVAFSQNLLDAAIEVYDVSGKLIFKDNADFIAGDTYLVNLESAAAGVYFYKIYNTEKQAEGKIVKQ